MDAGDSSSLCYEWVHVLGNKEAKFSAVPVTISLLYDIALCPLSFTLSALALLYIGTRE